MTNARTEVATPGAEVDQRDVLAEVDRLIAKLGSHPDVAVREQTAALLEGIDAVHRTALTHLVAAIHSMGGDAFLNRLSADPAIRLLLMSYDLLAVDRRLLAEEALDRVRGHLHAHGIDVELTDCVGGVVYVRLYGIERSGVDPESIKRDLEAALYEGLPGFQELVLREREASAGAFIQLGGVRRAQRPVYQRAAASSDVMSGALIASDVGGKPILIARVQDELYAVADRCGDTPLPLRFGELDGHIVRCSWHGCRYDVRTGRRCDLEPADEAVAERLAVFPIREKDGDVLVAVSVEPVAGG